MSGTFQHNAKGKRSICMDLKQPEARTRCMRLVPKVDALASNIRQAALARLGLDYEWVRRPIRRSFISAWSATAAAGVTPAGRLTTT